MSATTSPLRAVITADVIHSRQLDRFPAIRNRKLKKASSTHQSRGLVVSPYIVTTWDEFQNIASDPRRVPRLVFDLRRIFYPLKLRIGVGFGKVERPIRLPINQAGGEAFVLAREAVEYLKGGAGEKLDRMTFVRCADPHLQDFANLFFGLHDSLVDNISEKQWATIAAHMSSANQEIAARKLGVGKSTVSRNLRRAHYWQIEDSIESMETLIAYLLHANVQLATS